MPEKVDIQIINALVRKVNAFAKKFQDGHVLETQSKRYRAYHGCHLYDEFFSDLSRLDLFCQTAESFLGDKVYLHQLKINLKAAFCGESWPWHQDYIFWKNGDGFLSPNAVTVMVFLDDIDEFNGPLYLIPKSHHLGCIETSREEYEDDGWKNDVGNDLSYQLPNELISDQVLRHGLASAKGKKGTAVWFSPNIIHGSPANMSPFERRILLLTYNAVGNAPRQQNLRRMRPEFLCSRDHSPICPLTIETFFRKHAEFLSG